MIGKKSASVEKHNNENKCDKCEFTCSTESELLEHNQKQHTQTLNCDKCEYTCRSSEDLKKHKEKKHKENNKKELNCNKCEKRFLSEDALSNHTRNDHGQRKTSLTEDSYSCDECVMTCYLKDTLVRHKKFEHGGKSVYLCTVCEYGSTSKDDLRVHIKDKHSKELPDQEDTSHEHTPKRPKFYSLEEKTQNGYCAFWNQGYCRYEDLCRNLHKEIPACYYDRDCRRMNCKFYHEDRSQNNFLDWRTQNKYSYQEADFPPLPSQRRRH